MTFFSPSPSKENNVLCNYRTSSCRWIEFLWNILNDFTHSSFEREYIQHTPSDGLKEEQQCEKV